MSIRYRIILVIGLAAGLFTWISFRNCSPGRADEPAALPLPKATTPKPAPRVWRGVGSCSAASCHGGPNLGAKGSEETTWATSDPHARAYQVLFDNRSRAMVKNYYGLADLAQAYPEKEQLCLQCHVSPATARRPGVPALFHADGVSCETCHGPADAWLTEHYRPAWKTLTPAQKASTGFRPTKDLLVRAQDCVQCHVGAPGMEVNHDLLAAGHPRLNFEFASYQAILPRHWRLADERARHPDFEARAWLLGQTVCAKAALDLLVHRAKKADSPWPELSENACYRCHQDLRARLSVGSLRRGPGALSFNEWYYVEMPTVLSVSSKPDAISTELNGLREQLSRNDPNRQEVANYAARASAVLRDWLQQPLPVLRPTRIDELLRNRFGALEKDGTADWDRAAQDYLAAAALHNALKDLDPNFSDPAMQAKLRQRRKELEFPPRFNSPKLNSASKMGGTP